MPSLLKDPFQAKRTIARQQEKLRKEMKDLVKMRATGSKYGALKRQEKRRAEYHHDRMTEEKSLQEDLRRAEAMAKRIAQVLEQLRKDFNKMKNFAGNYNFANTVGMDSESSGSCQTDLSAAVDTREAWKNELENLLEMTWHYLDAQYLGNYAILHTVAPTDSNGSCSTVSSAKSCCSLVYRPAFHYVTPAGDCMSMPTSAGSASGDSSAVTSGDTVDSSRDDASVEATATVGVTISTTDIGAVTPDAEQGLDVPDSSRNHNQVSNCNIALRNVYRLLVDGAEEVWVSYISNEIATAIATTGTNSYETATSTDGGVTETARIAFLETYLESTTCLPAKMVEQISTDSADLAAWTSIASVSAAALAHAPTVANVEDEADLQFIFKMLTERMEKIRLCQMTNDREQQRIRPVLQHSLAVGEDDRQRRHLGALM